MTKRTALGLTNGPTIKIASYKFARGVKIPDDAKPYKVIETVRTDFVTPGLWFGDDFMKTLQDTGITIVVVEGR